MKKAFTLVELLVVIAIIGILSTLSVVALNSARAKARDARRLSDIKQIRTALDMYYDSAGIYPTSLIPGSPLSYNGLDFLAKVPDDPLSSQHYIYAQTENGQNYTIDFTLETKSAGYEPGNYQATPYAIVAGGGGGVFQCGDLLAYDGGPRDEGGNFTGNGGYYLTKDFGDGGCWFMDNLNAGDFEYGKKKCFNNEPGACDAEGGLYTKTQALALCPSGWSVPGRTLLSGVFSGLGFTASGFWDSTKYQFISTPYLVTADIDDNKNPYFYNQGGPSAHYPDDAASVRCVLYK